MLSLFRRIALWQAQTFPVPGTAGLLKHIQREFNELCDDPTDGEEMADMVILLVALAECQGLDLEFEIECKLAINRERTWSPPDEDGVIEHVRS